MEVFVCMTYYRDSDVHWIVKVFSTKQAASDFVEQQDTSVDSFWFEEWAVDD